MSIATPTPDSQGTRLAVRHALGWLVFGNAVGLYLAILLISPELQAGPWTYGRWMPIHLNVQLYGWSSLPLLAWLLSIYEVDQSRFAAWAPAAVWSWTTALAVGVIHWLGGITSGKLFLDWKAGALWAFIVAQVVLWAVLAAAWRDRRTGWNRIRRSASLVGLFGLALVPVAMWLAASPAIYPPIDRTTGGPTGSSLLGSALVVIGLMLILPRAIIRHPRASRNPWVWLFFAVSWIVFAITETIGGTHHEWHQIVAMLFLLPWIWLLPGDWKGFIWPQGSAVWRGAMFAWWGVLVVSGLLMYRVGVLDRIKFTQALVAHSHLAMAGFTTSFCALLCVLLTRRAIGGMPSVITWHVATLLMIFTLAVAGWMEGANASWMSEMPAWRATAFIVRAMCGAVMLAVSTRWLWKAGIP